MQCIISLQYISSLPLLIAAEAFVASRIIKLTAIGTNAESIGAELGEVDLQLASAPLASLCSATQSPLVHR